LKDPDAPFCSARCKEVDLGNWAMEKYVISTPAPMNPGEDRPDRDFDEED
jgi:hypothetical protein